MARLIPSQQSLPTTLQSPRPARVCRELIGGAEDEPANGPAAYNREIPIKPIDYNEQAMLLTICQDSQIHNQVVQEYFWHLAKGKTPEQLRDKVDARKFKVSPWMLNYLPGLAHRYKVNEQLEFVNNPTAFTGAIRRSTWEDERAWMEKGTGDDIISHKRLVDVSSGILTRYNPMQRKVLTFKAHGKTMHREVEQKLAFDAINPARVLELLEQAKVLARGSKLWQRRRAARTQSTKSRNSAMAPIRDKMTHSAMTRIHAKMANFAPPSTEEACDTGQSLKRDLTSTIIKQYCTSKESSLSKTLMSNASGRSVDVKHDNQIEVEVSSFEACGQKSTVASTATPSNPATPENHCPPKSSVPVRQKAQRQATKGALGRFDHSTGMFVPPQHPNGAGSQSTHSASADDFTATAAELLALGFTETAIVNIDLLQTMFPPKSFTRGMCRWIAQKRMDTKDIKAWIAACKDCDLTSDHSNPHFALFPRPPLLRRSSWSAP